MKRKIFIRNLPCRFDFKLLEKFISEEINKVDKIIEDKFSCFDENKI